MARLFQTGFEVGSFPVVGPTASPDARWWDSATTDLTAPRTGTQCLQLPGPGSFAYTFAAVTSRTIYVRFAFKKNSNPSIAVKTVGITNINGDDGPGTVWLNTNGTLEIRTGAGVRVGSASSALADDTWYVIEVQMVTTPTCSMALRVNGATIASGATSAAPYSTDQFVIANASGSGNTIFIDDFALNDSTGSVNNTWCGDGKVYLLRPISDNTVTNFTLGISGTTNLWDAVNNTPPVGVDNTAPNQWSNTSQIKCASSVNTSKYAANLTTYTSGGVTSPINAIVAWVCHAEEIATGTKTGALSLTANPVVAGATFNYGDDLGVIGDYPTGWRWKSLMAEAPTVTLGTSPVIQVTKTDATTRVAHVCFMGMYVDYPYTASVLLVVSDGTHAHTAANVVLVQQNALSVQGAAHAHTSANIALAQGNVLAAQNTAHAHAAANITLSLANILAVQNTAHDQTADQPTLSASAGAVTERHYQVTSVFGTPYVNDTGARQYLLPGGPYLNETAPTGAVSVTLATDSASHAHTAQNIALVQQYALTVNGAAHGHTAQNLVLSQQYSLAVNAATHAHTAQNVTLSTATVLAAQNASHAHTAQSPALTQAIALAMANALHAHTAQSVALTQANRLAINGAAHGHTAQSFALTQANKLVVNGATHAHTAQNVALTQAIALTMANTLHAHVAQSVALTQANQIAVQAATHGHSAQNVALIQANRLAVNGATHAHTAQTINLSSAASLNIANTLHAHTALNVSLLQGNTLAIQGALHAHAAQTISLSQAISLAVSNATHAHAAGSLLLQQANTLALANALHAHTAQNVTLHQANVLAINAALHGHTAQSVVLGQKNTLTLANTLHGHTVEGVVLVQANTLSVRNAQHAHSAQSIALAQANLLSVQGTIHGHSATSPPITAFLTIHPDSTRHVHSAQKIDLLQGNTLAVAGAVHAHTAVHVVLSQASVLGIADAYHAHSADDITLDLTIVLLTADCLHGHTAQSAILRPVRIVEFLAAAGQTLTAKLFEVASGTVVEEATSVVASLNRQMMYRAAFDAAPDNLHQQIVYAAGVPVAQWYVAIQPNPRGVYRSGNYADIVMAQSLELMRVIALNKTVTDPGNGVMTIFADDDVTPALTAQMFEDAAQMQPYRGHGAEVRERLQ